jgi:hypothetical protein
VALIVRPDDRYGEFRAALFGSKAIDNGPRSWTGLASDTREDGDHVAGQELPTDKASSECPDCGTEMVIVRITPILFGWKFEELSLICKTCQFAKKISIERSR